MQKSRKILQKIIKIQSVAEREQSYGVSLKDAFHRYIKPVYKISLQTYYKYLNYNAARELSEMNQREQSLLNDNQEAAYNLIVNQNRPYRDVAKTLKLTRKQVQTIANNGDFLYKKRLNATHKRNATQKLQIKKKADKLRYIAKIQKAANKYKDKYKSLNKLYLKVIKPKFDISYRTLIRYMDTPIEQRIKDLTCMK
jgi:hypothetical protein